MNVLNLIKSRAAIRKYAKTRISNDVILKILEAGIWGPSVLGFQPWKFVLVVDRKIKKEIWKIMSVESSDMGGVVQKIMKVSADTVLDAPVLILVYNIKTLTSFSRKFGRKYFKISKMAEIESIAAAIQNMVLCAESFELGTAWIDMPLLCASEINSLVKEKHQLIAILTLGYPLSPGVRSPRRNSQDKVRVIKNETTI